MLSDKPTDVQGGGGGELGIGDAPFRPCFFFGKFIQEDCLFCCEPGENYMIDMGELFY